MRILSAHAKTVAEPSGAVAPAAFLFHADELPQTTVNVAVISGGNIDPALLAELRHGGPV
jgi:threo-3-hydroxy-L-aspartate ammonia-lyase